MSNLIPIEINDQLQQEVSARKLHEGLGMNRDFTNWFKYQAEKLSLREGADFTPILAESTGGRPSIDYKVPIDIAKHICMISGGELAHQIREHFIQAERAWNSPEQVMARAVQIANQRINSLQLIIEEQKPKVIFAEALETSGNSILIGELAKILRQNGIEIGQNRLFEKLREEGYLIKRGESYNQPTQYSMEMGLFEIKKRTITNPDGSVRATTTTKVTGKGQIYFVNKFKKQIA
ncbi:phage antirepressor KilAC domain-containing protein [Desulfitobacterium chlororespirans]|uniref:Phage antirepressor protein YoqD, KilAC domain n=1 Tax=Desulfitobacterium chlororespirans DSM 11544 TaxID=1121395 RepID=A0A1M7U3K7_9FIRM|nr:phage antirepressor KilAC domain-containing protein [Desulfitobacterium chlororespirans]SHN77589.1 Phage antirepressor protein YoqD, KilAC domain [Desulfitobacterium chlororespirans DSM 11544]